MIGVFDSGVGGLTVLRSFLKYLPDYNYIYLGDNARLPYGDKSQETIYQYTKEAVDFLFAKGSSLIIIACNTASSEALRKLQQEYLPGRYQGKNVLGVVRPLAEKVASENSGKVGVIGTKATIGSRVYKIEINKLNPGIEVFERATPLLVPLIENNWSAYPETKTILKRYLKEFQEKRIESLILGCTHYQFLIDKIKYIMGETCNVYNPGEIIAESLKDYLLRHSEFNIDKEGKLEFYTTDSIENFKKLGEEFLGEEIKNIAKIKLPF